MLNEKEVRALYTDLPTLVIDPSKFAHNKSNKKFSDEKCQDIYNYWLKEQNQVVTAAHFDCSITMVNRIVKKFNSQKS